MRIQVNSVRTENWFQRLPFVFCLIIVCMYVYCEWGNLFLATFHSIALHFVISYHFWKYFGGHSTTKSGNDENRVRWTEYMYYGKSAMFTPNIFFSKSGVGRKKCFEVLRFNYLCSAASSKLLYKSIHVNLHYSIHLAYMVWTFWSHTKL